MIVKYKSVVLNGSKFQHLPADKRPERFFIDVTDEAGNVYSFRSDGSRAIKPTDLRDSQMSNGNRYGDWGNPIENAPKYITLISGDKNAVADDIRTILQAVERITAIPARFCRDEIVTVCV